MLHFDPEIILSGEHHTIAELAPREYLEETRKGCAMPFASNGNVAELLKISQAATGTSSIEVEDTSATVHRSKECFQRQLLYQHQTSPHGKSPLGFTCAPPIMPAVPIGARHTWLREFFGGGTEGCEPPHVRTHGHNDWQFVVSKSSLVNFEINFNKLLRL